MTIEPDELSELVIATQNLAVKVDTLGKHLQVSQRQVQRIRVLTIAAVIFFSLVATFGYIQWQRVTSSIDANKSNAITNCQNANESRKANKVLWQFLIDTSLDQGEQTPQSRELLTQLRDFVSDIYEQRDCSDLSKKYPLPPLPTVPEATAAK